jgi:6-phosphogluconolactonase
MKDVVIACLAAAGIYHLLGFAPIAKNEQVRVYVGTYTGGDSEGIYLLDLDLNDGELTSRGLVAKTDNPSFLAAHPDGNLLYAVNEVGQIDGKDSGGVSAFKIDPESGKLLLLNQQLSLGGAPCYLIVDRSGKHVLVANYGGGSVASLPIGKDGRLGMATSFIQHSGSSLNPDRQEGPHAHSINVDPANRFALAADLGLDEVIVYRFDPETGTLSENEPAHATVAAGAGPRHLAFSPDGRFAYVVNEMHLTVTAFSYNAEQGSLTEVQSISTLPDSATATADPASAHPAGYSTAEIQVHPTGRFLYVSNRGHNTIAVFAVDRETGKLTSIGYEPTQGRNPRNFAIDPTGQYLLAANQNSNTVVVFRIDQESGTLVATGMEASVPRPVCLKFFSTTTS